MKHPVHLIAAARPNFMKVAPLYHALRRTDWCVPILVHTGQHYDYNMSKAFLDDLGLPNCDIHLGVGSGTHAQQTAGVMIAYERALLPTPPAWVVVVGDVNSTMACTLVAKKLNIPVAHLESGLRSFDRTMPEEVNRVVTDSLSDLLWTPSADADQNLIAEGIAGERIVRVGNIMIDSLEMLRARFGAAQAYERFGVSPKRYALVTLHRPANVDSREKLASIVDTLVALSHTIPLVFPLHPRTRKNLEAFGLAEMLLGQEGIVCTDPLTYIDFMSLMEKCVFALTDSGGIQEETTCLNVPCMTLRSNTERPITLTIGTNKLVGIHEVLPYAECLLAGHVPQGKRPPLWDGHTAKRATDSLRGAIHKSL
jgi:UDP-N-acetylglucosamine 2-epimerase (non-hydrolysing)